MQLFTITLFKKDDTAFELRVLGEDGSCLFQSTQLITEDDFEVLNTIAALGHPTLHHDLVERGQ